MPRRRAARLADRSALRVLARPRRQRREIIAELDEIFATKPLDEWAKVFAREPDFFWAPINSIEDVVADEQFHAAGGVVYVPDGDGECADGRDAGGLPRHTGWAPAQPRRRLGEHTEKSLPNSRRVMLDARGVPKLLQKILVIVAAHQVMRNRHAHSGCHRQARVGPLCEPLESVPHQRNDL